MPGVPSQLIRPAAVLPDPVAAADGLQSLTFALDGGIPARIPLSGTRALVVGAGLGQARRWLDLDPATVVLDLSAPVDLSGYADPDEVVARLTLVEGSTLGETAQACQGLPLWLSAGGRVCVEVVVDSLVLTAGSLRSPGQLGSSITLRWRDVPPADDVGPVLATGDPSIPRSMRYLPLRLRLRSKR